MFLNPWSLALSICSVAALVLGAFAAHTAVRVLRFWDLGSDSNRQIRLESEIWLSSTLMAYGLGFQLLTLVLFVLAADQYAQSIAGAMCATGSLLANGYGIPALLVKISGVFFYGFWLLLHQLDIRSEHYPLVRVKYRYLLVLMPFLLLDVSLQTLYIAGLKPDIITSCCAVVFSAQAGGGTNLISGYSDAGLLAVFLGSSLLLSFLAVSLLRKWRVYLTAAYSALWVFYFFLSLVAVTSLFSSYVYAMPYHKCPFCLLKPEYSYFGFALYGTLFPGAFWGASVALVGLVRGGPGLSAIVGSYQRWAVKISLVMLGLFVSASGYHYLKYLLTGGEG